MSEREGADGERGRGCVSEREMLMEREREEAV